MPNLHSDGAADFPRRAPHQGCTNSLAERGRHGATGDLTNDLLVLHDLVMGAWNATLLHAKTDHAALHARSLQACQGRPDQ